MPQPSRLSASEFGRLRRALPFWMSLGLLPLAACGAWYGGWSVLLLPLYGWVMVTVLDRVTGRDDTNPDPQSPRRICSGTG